jgi:hypothetical protein
MDRTFYASPIVFIFLNFKIVSISNCLDIRVWTGMIIRLSPNLGYSTFRCFLRALERVFMPEDLQIFRLADFSPLRAAGGALALSPPGAA